MRVQEKQPTQLADGEPGECTLDMIRNSPLFWNVEIMLWGVQLVYSGLLAFAFTVFTVISIGHHEGVVLGLICMAVLAVVTLLWFLDCAINIVLTFRKIRLEEVREQQRAVRRREQLAWRREHRRKLEEICADPNTNQEENWSIEVYTPGWHMPF